MHAITALIPVKNGERFLPDFLESISKICTGQDEILFINDGSNDETPRMLHEFCRQNTSAKIENNPGQGLVDALNFGIGIARHDWIARFDVDDSYEDFRLDFQRRLIDESISAIFCDYQFEGVNGENLGTITSGITHQVNIVSLVNNWRTPHPGVLINKRLLLAVNGYSKDEYPVEDLGLWLRLKEVGYLISSPNVLFKYRLNPNSISATNQEIMAEKKSQLLDKYNDFDSAIKSIESKFWETYREYAKYSRRWDRRLLLIVDYISLLKRNKLSLFRNKIILFLFLRVIFNPLMLITLTKLGFFKLLRYRYRRLKFSKKHLRTIHSK